MAIKRTPTKRKQSKAGGILPRYKLDDGPLTQAQMDAIDRLQPPGRTRVTKSLF